MATVGTMAITIFSRFQDYNVTSRIPISLNCVAGPFWFFWDTTQGQVSLNFPVSSGTAGGTSAVGVFKLGRPYTLFIHWNITTMNVELHDICNDTYSTIITATCVPAVVPTQIYLGRYYGATGYFMLGFVDNLRFWDTEITTEPGTNNSCKIIEQFGDSIVSGFSGSYGGDCTGTNNGWRAQFFNDGQRDNRGYYFAGGIQKGDIICPYTDAVSGSKAVDVLALIAAQTAATKPGVVIVSVGTNDAGASTNITTFKTQMAAISTSITAYSATCRQIFSGIVPRGDGQAISTYDQAIQTVVATCVAGGANIGFIGPIATPTFCADLLHPSDAVAPAVSGNSVLGDSYYSFFPTALFTPTVAPTPIPSSGLKRRSIELDLSKRRSLQ